jgi:hypothetical protein
MQLPEEYLSLLSKLTEAGLIHGSLSRSGEEIETPVSALNLTTKGHARFAALKSALDEATEDMSLTVPEVSCLALLVARLPPMPPLSEGESKPRF